MEILGIKLVEKLKRKNKGNSFLISEIDNLISVLEKHQFKNQLELTEILPDADCVHKDGFYFFNINIHRTLILIEFEEDGEATIVWCGSHSEYENTFKNNKNTIKKWLKNKGWIN